MGTSAGAAGGFLDAQRDPAHAYDAQIRDNTRNLISQGRDTFRNDTLGRERFFGNTIGLHKAIEGDSFGGVGAGVSPKTALAVGLKVDSARRPGQPTTRPARTRPPMTHFVFQQTSYCRSQMDRLAAGAARGQMRSASSPRNSEL